MCPLFFKKTGETSQQKLSVVAAHGFWRLLSERYYILDQMGIIRNFIHDKDFKYLVDRNVNTYEKEVEELLKQMEHFDIPGPTPATEGRNVTGNSQVITDKAIAQILFRFMQSDVSLILETLRGVTTNDDIMEKFIQYTDKAIGQLGEFIMYMKLKGWADIPPLYPYVPSELNEKVAANEIFLLFDHLVFRYNSLQYTNILLAFVDDPDLKVMLQMGLVTLSDQVKALEKELNRLGVPLPYRYSRIIPKPEDTQILEDRFIFNVVLNGIENAALLHGSALKEIIVNDRLRPFFRQLTLAELKYVAAMVKYGKLKGWLNVSPLYRFGAK
jgi:hypothetical protein